MRSRVLFLDHVGALGGAELALIDVARAYRDTSTFLLFADGPFRTRLERQGIQVEVIEGGTALHSVRRETRWPGPRVGWDVLSLAARIAPLARRHDFLHANSQKAFIVACVAGAVARRPVIWDLNDLLIDQHFSRLNITLDVLLARHCAVRVMVNSEASARALIAQGGPAHKVRVVYNGIDAAPFDAVTDAEIAAARDEFGIGSRPAIAVFGRLAEWKGQRTALQALRHLPDVDLLLVGDALFGEDAYAKSLRSDAVGLGVADRVRFAGFRADIPCLMRAVDVILHTSIAPEPFGRVIVEGMLARRPVVATRGGGVDEIIDSGHDGMLIPAGDPDLLAGAVDRLLRDPVEADRMGRAGRETAERKFTVNAMVETMSRNIEELAGA
ncbi:MAG TPA: glycosyltransferase family 4 protein [Gemmatimonadales bacterium]|jgi:glycosyltransferase involved in cell wall biosynthesis